MHARTSAHIAASVGAIMSGGLPPNRCPTAFNSFENPQSPARMGALGNLVRNLRFTFPAWVNANGENAETQRISALVSPSSCILLATADGR